MEFVERASGLLVPAGCGTLPGKRHPGLKPECPDCPCFQVESCDECESEMGGICAGFYPPMCTAEDCVVAKLAAAGGG